MISEKNNQNPTDNDKDQSTDSNDLSPAHSTSRVIIATPSSLTRYIGFYKTHRPKSKGTRHIPPQVLQTRRTIQSCCRDDNLSAALDVLSKSIEDCVYIEPRTLCSLLNLCEGGFGEREREGRIHVGTPKTSHDKNGGGMSGKPVKSKEMEDGPFKEISLKERLEYAEEIRSLLVSLGISAAEPAYTALIRLASRAGDRKRAEMYLDEAERTPQCKMRLRTYSGLLRGYCGDYHAENTPTKDDLVGALKVWNRMYRNSGESFLGKEGSGDGDDGMGDGATIRFGEGICPKIHLSEIEYSSLIRCATKLHDVPVVERVLSDLAERVLIPGLQTTEGILDWFRSDRFIENVKEKSSVLESVDLPPREGASIGQVSNENGKGWRIYRCCTIDSITGMLSLGGLEGDCSENGDMDGQSEQFTLRPFELSGQAWDEMRQMNTSIVLEGQVEGHVSQFQGGGKGKKRPLEEKDNGNNGKRDHGGGNNHQHRNRGYEWRINAWNEFDSFLQNHPPYDIVIDGANVGYFQQNFSNAPKHVDYNQIDWLLRHLLQQSETTSKNHIILFLHERHFSSRLCPSWAQPLLQAWESKEPPYNRLAVYQTPSGMNDDWYWMHAALINGGRTNYPSVLAITNDEMRDHHFQMLARGSFLRWKERHQVHFDFGQWNERTGGRDVLLRYPSRYSRRMQSLDGGEAIVIPLPKKGDEGRYVDGAHVADDGAPEEETYVFIQRVN